MEQILSVLYLIVGLCTLILTAIIALYRLLDRQDGRTHTHTATLIDYAKQKYEQSVQHMKKRRLKNVNKTPVIPDVPDEMLRQFARVLLHEIEQAASVEDVSLTETTWITDGKFKELIGGSRKQFTACMDRFEAARIVTRGGGKNTRVWAMPYRSITAKLQKFTHSPYIH